MNDKLRISIYFILIGALAGILAFRLAALGRIPINVSNQPGVTTTRELVNEESAVTNAVDKASSSVVAIGEVSNPQQFAPFNPFNPFVPIPQQPSQPTNNTIGTGFVVAGDVIVTNKHVVSDVGVSYTVVTKDGKKLDIQKIYRDPVQDLAIIKVGNSNLKPLDLGDSSKLKVGQTAIAIGNALGQFDNTVTTGVVSGLSRTVSAGDPFSGQSESLVGLIQTDAAINPGNSGGPLLNSSGQVIGINVATTQGAQNIGFAIPINTVKTLVDEFNKTGTISRPFLGVSYTFVSRDLSVLDNIPQGAYVRAIVSGSPAEKAGITPGDIITKIDNQSVDNTDKISAVVQSKKVGDSVSLDIWNNESQRRINVNLVESPNQ